MKAKSPTIACVGPISSGTRLLTAIVTRICPKAHVIHHSNPWWDRLWDHENEFPPKTRFVIILRRPDFSVMSASAQGHGDPALEGWGHLDHKMTHQELDGWWWSAMAKLAAIPDAYWISYEALVAEPRVQAESLARWLGHPDFYWRRTPVIKDANAKWREQQF